MSVVPPPGSLTVGGDNRQTHLTEPNETPSIPPIPPIPHLYGENRLLLLVRDPTTLFAAWEVTPEAIGEALVRLERSRDSSLTLRLLQLGPAYRSELVQEHDVSGADRWYLYHDRPGMLLLAQIGVGKGDAFIPILQSHPVRTPPGTESAWIDAEWTTIEEVLERSRAGQYRASSGHTDL